MAAFTSVTIFSRFLFLQNVYLDKVFNKHLLFFSILLKPNQTSHKSHVLYITSVIQKECILRHKKNENPL